MATLGQRGQSRRRPDVGMGRGDAAAPHTQEVAVTFGRDGRERGVGGRRAPGAVDVGHERGGRCPYDGVEVDAHDVRQRRHGQSSLLGAGLPGASGVGCKEIRREGRRGARSARYGRAGHIRAGGEDLLRSALAGLGVALRKAQGR